MGKKPKKEKIVYVDDGRTIADMSGVSAGASFGHRDPVRPRPKIKDVWDTYWAAVKMMFFPMLTVIAALILIYLVITLIFILL